MSTALQFPERPQRHPDTFRMMVIVSLGVHIGLLGAAVTLPGMMRQSTPPILVTMVSLPGGGGGGPKGKSTSPAPAQKGPPKAEEPPAESAKPKLTYPDKTRPAKKPEPAKKPTGQETRSQQTTKPTAAAAGKLESTFDGAEFSTGVGTGAGSGDGGLSGFPFAFYLQRVRDKISSNWFQSLVVGQVTGQFRVTIFFQILRDGRVTNVQVEESSGISSLDLSAQRAVYASNPMPPLPQGYAEDTLNVHFRFHYEQ